VNRVISRSKVGLAQALQARTHTLVADEPEAKGGTDAGPTPGELLALSLASCTAITLEMYARRKDWDLGALQVSVEYDPEEAGHKDYEVVIEIPAQLSTEQAEKLKMIAGKCPVHRILTGEVEITDRIVEG
jgi:putative redox protein